MPQNLISMSSWKSNPGRKQNLSEDSSLSQETRELLSHLYFLCYSHSKNATGNGTPWSLGFSLVIKVVQLYQLAVLLTGREEQMEIKGMIHDTAVTVLKVLAVVTGKEKEC